MSHRRPPPPPPPSGAALEASMRRMNLDVFPERPGEPDCAFYLYNGSCGYGERCRYNHPRDRSSAVARAGMGGVAQYPERAGQPACQYFMKNGTCKYGLVCKYDHPKHGNVVVQQVLLNYKGYPLRMGEQECAYYLKTGQCKYGLACKFHHPEPTDGSVPSTPQAYYPPPQSSSVQSSNGLSVPSSPQAYYPFTKSSSVHSLSGMPVPPILQTFYPSPQSSCVHSSAGTSLPSTPQAYSPLPQASSMHSGMPVAPTPHAYYPLPQSSSVHSSTGSLVPSPQAYYTLPLSTAVHTIQHDPNIGVTRPQVLAQHYIQGPYGPMFFSPPVVPFPGWTPYPVPVRAGLLNGSSSHQLSPLAPAYQGSYPTIYSSGRPPSGSEKEHMLPERPGQAECRYYMTTGDCKFRSRCNYHHPPDRSISETKCDVSPMNLPVRPGASSCTFFAKHGVCKFGLRCRYDHSTGTLGQNPASPADSRVTPYPAGMSATPLATSSSPFELQQHGRTFNSNGRFTRRPSSTNARHPTSFEARVHSPVVYVPRPTSATNSNMMAQSGRIPISI